MRLKTFLSAGLIALLTSCSTTMKNYYGPTVQSWQGANVNTLMQRWGRPDTRVQTPEGKSVLVYKTENYSANMNTTASPSIGVTVDRTGRPVITNQTNMGMMQGGHRGKGVTMNCLAIFIADKKGTITETSVQGNGCYGGEGFAQRLSNPGTSH